MTSICFPGQVHQSPFNMAATLKGKNLLKEKILSFKQPPMKWEKFFLVRINSPGSVLIHLNNENYFFGNCCIEAEKRVQLSSAGIHKGDSC